MIFEICLVILTVFDSQIMLNVVRCVLNGTLIKK